MSEAAARRATASVDGSQRPLGTGGTRLADAFERVSSMPALADARRRLLRLADREAASPGEVADAIESDAALAIVVMRAASNGQGPPGGVAGVREAVEALGPTGVKVLAGGLQTYDLFDEPRLSVDRHERFRRHAVGVRRVADHIGDVAHVGKREELAVAALVHDIGRLVLIELYGEEYAGRRQSETPDDQVHRERRDLGIDHALVGAVLVRRWGLRPGIATAVEQHHSQKADGHAAVLRLADGIVHYVAGERVHTDSLVKIAAGLEIGPDRLRSLIYEFPYVGESRRRTADPCPLSAREIDALRGLAEGKVYKQIAQELNLSVSTIRTHLHNVYRKIGAVDRAQAVLLARDRGWI
jgi:putative nucleotidyltransferase with HDIG domain